MSFGFSVGDFLATLKLADDLKKRFAQAPSEFKAISGEVRSLWAVLHDLNDIPKQGISMHQNSEMELIVQKGREVLLEIEDKLSKYNVLAYTTSNWKTKALRAWSRINWDPAEVSSLRSRITSCISLSNLVLGKINQDLTLEIGAEIHSMKENHDIQLRNEILPRIYPVDPSERQRKAFNVRREGTGKWFLESEQFLCWVSNEKKQTLLCTGVPGAGKTVLASIVIDHLEKKFANNDGIAITYLYFDYRQQLEFPDLLSVLLRQLLQGNPGLYGTISGMYRRHERDRLSEEAVQKELMLVISQCSEVFIVIDALDECLNVRVNRQFLNWIQKLLVFNKHTNIKVLATTRHEDYFANVVFKDLLLEIKASREDIESFLDANLVYLPGFIQRKPELWGYIRNQIIESSGEMFLLARLYLNLLLDEKNEKRVRTLGTQLQSGSGAYDSVYDETMKRIEQQSSFSKDLAKRILGWLTFSTRPLTAVELQNAIAVEIGEPLFDETNITDIEEMILVCSGLVVVETNSNVAKLVHFTTQEYLKRTSKSWFSDVHDFLTDTCLTYLSFDNFDFQIQEERYPFYQYSAHGLQAHLRQSLGNDPLLPAFARNDAKVSLFMREIFGLSGTEYNFTGLHFASLFGLEHIVEGFSPTNSNFDVWDYLGRTPLTWAAASGNEGVVRLLLDRGSNPNSATKESFTPLFYAAAYGHVAVAKDLIDEGADVNFQNSSNETPIFFAAKGGDGFRLGPRSLWRMGDHALVMKLLLDTGANINHENNRRETPLYFAADNDHEGAVKILLERNAKVNSNYGPQPSFETALVAPLAAAARKGHVRIAKLLLETGAYTPSLTNDTNMSPYFHALSCLSKPGIDEESSFAAIFKETDNPSFHDEFKRVPLHWAASRGDSILVQRILKAGCNPNPKDTFGRTPLFEAVCRHNLNVVKILLDHPDIDAQSEDILGSTPLLESYKRHVSPNDPFAFEVLIDHTSPWEEITDLLEAKTGLHRGSLPNINALSFTRYPPSQPEPQQISFRRHCDVCLGKETLPRIKCRSCSVITQKDGTSGGTVTYCESCIQGLKHCPLCGQSF